VNGQIKAIRLHSAKTETGPPSLFRWELIAVCLFVCYLEIVVYDSQFHGHRIAAKRRHCSAFRRILLDDAFERRRIGDDAGNVGVDCFHRDDQSSSRRPLVASASTISFLLVVFFFCCFDSQFDLLRLVDGSNLSNPTGNGMHFEVIGRWDEAVTNLLRRRLIRRRRVRVDCLNPLRRLQVEQQSSRRRTATTRHLMTMTIKLINNRSIPYEHEEEEGEEEEELTVAVNVGVSQTA